MTILQAQNIAESHADSFGEIAPGITLGISKSQTFQQCFYFDFRIIHVTENTTNKLPRFGGGPGVIVDKRTGKVNTITFSQLASLRSEQENIEFLCKIMYEHKDQNNYLKIVKEKLHLTSVQLLNLKKDIDGSEWKQERVLNIIQELLNQQNNTY